jgi:predicted CDP-diglyceride synthetase/phosphatidate cytidylyltransferase
MTPGFSAALLGLGIVLIIATAAAELARWRWPTPEKRQVCLRVYTWWGIVVVVGLALAAGQIGIALLVAGMVAGTAVELRRLTMGKPVRQIILTGLVGVACAHLWWLYRLGEARSAVIDPRLMVLGVLLLIEFNDVAQYLWGRSLGRHRLAPRLSPGKTVEGAVGGVMTTLALAWGLKRFWGLESSAALILGGVVAVSGIAGDLAVSALKRSAAVKDAGTLLPGHGGLLDRLDSFLLAGPGAFYTLSIIWRGV